MQKEGVLITVSGPSGVGKGTIVKEVLRLEPNIFVSVSCTTRNPRPGEQDGVDYFFLSTEEFDRRVAEDYFFEWKCVHGTDRYGTPRAILDEKRREGRDILLEIDVQGSMVAMAREPKTVGVFVLPPSVDELRKRLEGRRSESVEDQNRRLRTAISELEAVSKYKYAIVNDSLEQAIGDLRRIFRAERGCDTAEDLLSDRLISHAEKLIATFKEE